MGTDMTAYAAKPMADSWSMDDECGVVSYGDIGPVGVWSDRTVKEARSSQCIIAAMMAGDRGGILQSITGHQST